jgi:hypothetical protein
LVIEKVGSSPQLTSDLHVLFERDGSKASPPVDLFHDGAIGVRPITGHPSEDAQGLPLKGRYVTAFFSHFLETYFSHRHSLEYPYPNIVGKFLPFEKFTDGVSLSDRKDGRICPCLLNTERKKRKERKSQKIP